VISQEQALALADRWLNPEGPAAPRREVRMREFDLGWVVWAEAGDPHGAEAADVYGFVDRRTGELTVWPSVPAEEVVRMYRERHIGGAPDRTAAEGARPVTGPGNTAVFTFTDPVNGEETTLFRTSGPGLPPAEYQAWAELRRLNVPESAVLAIHTDLRPGLLPGGYTAALLNQFRNARLSFSQNYGVRPEDRTEGVAALVEQVEVLHRTTGRQPPPRPHRQPVPTRARRAEPMDDASLGRHLVEVFGQEGVCRHDADTVAATPLPEATKSALTRAGLPADLPLFFTADRPDAPPVGGLFTDAATNLRERRSPADEGKITALAHLVRIGFDGVAVVAVQCLTGTTEPDGLGTVWAVHPVTADARYINASAAAFARCLALLSTTRQHMRGLDPAAAGTAVAALQERLVAVDPSSLGDPDTWWSLIVEQMWHGLL
jgi:hypothetical protein